MPEDARKIVRLRWGLAPSWARDARTGSRLINARAESVHYKPSFRAAFRLCRDRSPRCGSWDRSGAPLETFTIITTAVSLGLEDIHHRQPAIIDPRWFTQWLDPRMPLLARLELAQQPHDGPFERRAVSARVNSVRNDDPDVLTAASDSGLL